MVASRAMALVIALVPQKRTQQARLRARLIKALRKPFGSTNSFEGFLRVVRSTKEVGQGKQTRRLIAEQGTYGQLAYLLTDNWFVDNPLAGLAGWPKHQPFGTRLVEGFNQGGWKGMQLNLLWRHPLASAAGLQSKIWKLAFMETLVFERAGCRIAWCQHKKHWFVSNDRRRKDCLEHRKAGQQVRWYRKSRTKDTATR